MTRRPLRVLLVEDDRGDARLVRESLAEAGLAEVTWVERLGLAIANLAEQPVDLVLLDLGLPDAQGLDGLRRLLGVEPPIPVVVLTGLADDETALAALEHGAQDYLMKGMIDPDLLRRTIRYAVERHRVQQALIQREESYQALVDSIPEIVYSRTVDGTVTFIGAKVDLVCGVTREQLYRREKTWFDLVHPADAERVKAEVSRTVAAAQEFKLEYRLIDRHARRRWFVDHGHGVRDEGGGEPRIDGILFDITERRHGEERHETELVETRDALEQLQRLTAPRLDPTLARAVRSEEELAALQQSYSTTLLGYVEARRLGDPPDRATARALAERLARLGATPNDVVRMHLAAVSALPGGGNDVRLAPLSRLLLLELMGYLADQYRQAAALAPHPPR